MTSGLTATGYLLLLLFAICEARPVATLQESTSHVAKLQSEEATERELVAATSCKAFDIKINQGEASGVGLPEWVVQITNTCINPRCSISKVIVHCGQFASASLVNPAVFRRLDSTQGTCIVKNGNVIGNGEMVTFRYKEIFMEPVTLKSAEVSCSG